MIPFLIVFFIGWLLFFIGFMLQIHDAKDIYATTFYYSPEIIAVAAGPVVVVVGFLHAAFSGPVSAFLGMPASFFSILCSMGFGYNIYDILSLVYYKHVLMPPSAKLDNFVKTEGWLKLVGSCLASLAWMFIMISWNFFVYHWKPIQADIIVDEDGNLTGNNYLTRMRRSVMFAGVARKVASVVILLLSASWCLYIAGVVQETRGMANATIGTNATTFSDRNLSVPLPFSTWASCVVGLLAILSASTHAGAYGGASTAMGVSTAFLGMLFIASVGYVGLDKAILIHINCHIKTWNCYILDTTVPKYLIYQLSGALGMCLWWACLAALWPLYFKEYEVVRAPMAYRQERQQVQQDDETVPLL